MNIYFDMDGVLAKWNADASLEDTFERGYFRKREVEWKIKKVIRELYDEGYPVHILTAAYVEGTAVSDKMAWLDKQELGDIPAIMAAYGSRKSDFVPGGRHILIDDFTRNLFEWEEDGHVGVKFYNGINGTHGHWGGYSIDRNQTPQQMATIIKAIFTTSLKQI